MLSDAFDKNPASHSDVIAVIIKDIEQGKDLTKYLSRRVKIGFELPPNPAKKKLNKLCHLDLLLNEWRIHHMHLSTTIKPDGFVVGGKPLLFAMFIGEKAYLLDIANHKSFEDDQLVKIAVSNWPSDQLFPEIKGIVRLEKTTPYSTDDRKQLRAAGISSFVPIDNRVYSPPGGISAAGTSSEATDWSNRVIRSLRHFENEVEKNPSPIIDLIRQNGGNPSEKTKFKFTIFDNGFGVIEIQSGAAIILSG